MIGWVLYIFGRFSDVGLRQKDDAKGECITSNPKCHCCSCQSTRESNCGLIKSGNDIVNISCTCGGDIINECNIRAMGELVNQQEQRPIHN